MVVGERQRVQRGGTGVGDDVAERQYVADIGIARRERCGRKSERGARVEVTVTLDPADEIATPCGLVPTAVAVLVTPPASTSAWVTV